MYLVPSVSSDRHCFFGLVTQLVECQLCKLDVVGSNPIWSTIFLSRHFGGIFGGIFHLMESCYLFFHFGRNVGIDVGITGIYG